MCGLVGAVGPGSLPLPAALRALAHRGPDDEGTWEGPAGAEARVQLGFRRLSIQDLSPAGHQPMASDDGSVVIVFNGEIYNAPALREELRGSGPFRSTSDTEAIVRGYQKWGDAVLDRLRGMFALAIWDARRERLLVARDRLGIKPLYYTEGGNGLCFASEIKGLLALGVPAELDPAALADYLRYLYVPGPRTLFRGIHQLPAAHRLVWERGATRVERFWALRPAGNGEMSAEDAARELRRVLEETVRMHLLSDVPLGAFLSGGLDSTAVVALMARAAPAGRPVRTFTMTFGEALYDERAYASEVARRYGTNHTEIPVKPELVELLPAMVRGFDEPFGNPTALLMYLLSRETRKHVTVALSGDGGDEIFLGYPRYQGARLAGAYRVLPRFARRAVAAGASRLPEDRAGRHGWRRIREFASGTLLSEEAMYASWVEYRGDAEVGALLAPALRAAPRRDFIAELFADERGGDLVDRASRVDLRSFLPHNVLAYSDRMSMAHGLEVRVPFCDHVLVEAAAAVPARLRMRGLSAKWLYRRAVADLLPASVKRRRKLGLNPPMGVWIDRELRDLVGEYLAPDRVARRGLLDPEGVASLVAEQRAGRRDLSLQIWSLVVLEEWYRTYVERAAASAAAA